jgi:ATP-dependent Clp protease ATP-binding subunit ClpB
MHPTAAMKRVRPAVFALALAACATAPARYEPGTPTAEQTAKLKAAETGAAGGKKEFKLLRNEVGAEEIAEVVSRATGIPVSKMMQGERDKLLQMEERLHRRVVGQD